MKVKSMEIHCLVLCSFVATKDLINQIILYHIKNIPILFNEYLKTKKQVLTINLF